MTYISTADLAAYLDITDSVDNAKLGNAVAAAIAEIDGYCRRPFTKAATATARRFMPLSPSLLVVDDFWTTDDLEVDGATPDADNLEPFNGVVDGLSGFPYWKVRGRFAYSPVLVTAKWGWTAVPQPVRQAALIVGAEIFKLAEAPFGVAGFGEFGAVRVRNMPQVSRLLEPYRRDRVPV